MNVLVIDFQSSCLNVEQMNTFQRAPSTSTFIVPVQRIVSLLLETGVTGISMDEWRAHDAHRHLSILIQCR